MTLDRFANQGRADALVHFKVANAPAAAPMPMSRSAPPKIPGAAMGAVVNSATGEPTAGNRVRGFLGGQADAAKGLFHNMQQGLGGAPDAAAGAAARGAIGGNLKALAPSLLAGGGLYMLHRHHQQQEEEQQRQQAMMHAGGGGGGFPGMM